MKRKILYLIILLFISLIKSEAQNIDLRHNWSIQGALGVQHFLANPHRVPVSGGSSALFSVAVQNDCFTYSSLRVKLDGLSFKTSDELIGNKRNYTRLYSRPYLNGHFDWMLSLRSLIEKKESSFWDLQPYLGLGVATSNIRAMRSVMSLNAGIAGEVEINPRLCLTGELQAAFLPDNFDRVLANRSYEPIVGFSIGLKYHFGTVRRPRREIQEREVIRIIRDTVVVERVIEVKPDPPTVIDSCKLKNEAIENRQLAKIHYERDQWKVKDIPDTDKECILSYLKESPTHKLLLRAMADRVGTNKSNRKVAKHRARTVKHILIRHYGVDANKIEVLINDPFYPYEKYSENRVLIIEKNNGIIQHIKSCK